MYKYSLLVAIWNDPKLVTIEKDDNGNNSVVYHLDKDFFDNNDNSTVLKVLGRLITNKYQGKQIPIGNDYSAAITSATKGEFLRHVYKSNEEGIKKAKYSTLEDLYTLMKTATPTEHNVPDINNRHKGATGWDYFAIKFGVSDGETTKYYTGKVNIQLRKTGPLFYDITEIKPLTKEKPQGGIDITVAPANGSSNNNIANANQKINIDPMMATATTPSTDVKTAVEQLYTENPMITQEQLASAPDALRQSLASEAPAEVQQEPQRYQPELSEMQQLPEDYQEPDITGLEAPEEIEQIPNIESTNTSADESSQELYKYLNNNVKDYYSIYTLQFNSRFNKDHCHSPAGSFFYCKYRIHFS